MNSPTELPGLLDHLSRTNKRFYYLSSLVMSEGVEAFVAKIESEDLWIDPDTQVSLLHMAVSMGCVGHLLFTK